MQKLTPEIIAQLNNLPGFPAIPNTTPPSSDRWILGDWIFECRVNPAVANAAALPLTGNTTGDVRVSIADQAWYIWDGAAWQAVGGGGGGLPAPPLNSIQYNNAGAFGGSAALIWDNGPGTLQVDGAVDRVTAGTLTVGGTTATAITIGSAGITTTFPGPVALTGDVTTVGGTTFTTDATFEGNVTFGAGAADTVTFAPLTTITSNINFGGGVGTYKITNLANGTNPNDAVNVSQLSGMVTGSGTATQLAYFTGASAIGSENATGTDALTWDAGANELGVRTNNPLAAVDVADGQLAVNRGTTAAPSIALRDNLDTGFFAPAVPSGATVVTNEAIDVSLNNSDSAGFRDLSAAGPITATQLFVGVDATDFGILTLGQRTIGGEAISLASAMIEGHINDTVTGTGTAAALYTYGATGVASAFIARRARGTQAARAAVQANDMLGTFSGSGFDGTAFTLAPGQSPGLRFFAAETFTGTNAGAYLEFWTVPTGSKVPAARMHVAANGNVGIGNTAPSTLLSIGSTEQFRIDSSGQITRYANAATTKGNLLVGNGTSTAYAQLAVGTDNFVLTADSSATNGVAWKTAPAASLTVGSTSIASGAVNRILFQGAGNVLQEDASLTWDDANNRLGVGTSTPSNDITVQKATSGTNSILVSNTQALDANAHAAVYVSTEGAGRLGALVQYSRTAALFTGQTALWSSSQDGINIIGDNAVGGIIRFSTGGTTERARFDLAGRLLIGTTTPGERLTVSGGISQSGGVVTLSANGASSFTTSAGALTLTSAAAATWSTTSGALTLSAASGAINLTASANLQISANGNATTWPTVAGTSGQVLTNNGSGTLSWATPSTSAGTVDITATAFEALNSGDLVVFMNDAGTPKVQKADATNTDARLNPVGFTTASALAGASVTVRVAGVADIPAARFDAAPAAANVGQRVFVSTNVGQITLTAPAASGDVLQRAGVLVDGGANPKVLVQIGDPTLL